MLMHIIRMSLIVYSAESKTTPAHGHAEQHMIQVGRKGLCHLSCPPEGTRIPCVVVTVCASAYASMYAAAWGNSPTVRWRSETLVNWRGDEIGRRCRLETGSW